MEGIIKLFGEITDIIYQNDSTVTISLNCTQIYRKSVQTEYYETVDFCASPLVVDIPYGGPVSLSEMEFQKFHFGKNINHGTNGFGAKISDLRHNHKVDVYIHWRTVGTYESKQSFVIQHIVVFNKSKLPENLTTLVELLATLP